MSFDVRVWGVVATMACTPAPLDVPAESLATISGTVSMLQPASSEPTSIFDSRFKAQVLRAFNRSDATETDSLKSQLDVAPSLPLPWVPSALSRASFSRIQLGEAIVRFKEKISVPMALSLPVLSRYACAHSGFASEYLHLLKCSARDGAPLSEEQTRNLVRSLEQENAVKFAEVNSVRDLTSVPNDKFYPAMWHLPAISLPAAWSIESGATHPIIIAVIDTGSLPHPELSAQLLPGYDMITDTQRSSDGDGRDSDATDVGDNPKGHSSYHGLLTSGAIGATTNNMSGIAGVHWNARIIPMRAMGIGGGTDFDIAASIQWASGGVVPQTTQNANRAVVINLSVSGKGAPTKTYQDVIDGAAAQGVVIVVSAGNANTSASGMSPCNQERVLCIGATRIDGARASYSNYGARVDIMAPGGDLSQDTNADGDPDGVLSLGKDDAKGTYGYRVAEGTSMAAPIVSGVVALLKSKAPLATFDQVKAALINSADSQSKCREGCGAGLVNALGALNLIQSEPNAGPAKMILSVAEIWFTPQLPTSQLQITNSGGAPLSVAGSFSGLGKVRMSAEGLSFTIEPGATETLTLKASLSGIPDRLSVSAALFLMSNGGTASVNLHLNATAPSATPASIALVYKDSVGNWQVKKTVLANAPQYEWTMDVSPGSYFLFGAQDTNSNGVFEESEPVGLYPNLQSPHEIKLASNQSVDGFSFALVQPLTDNSSSLIGRACQNDSLCRGGFCAMNFTDGYCTQDCSSLSCPTDARCLTLGRTPLCLRTCADPVSGRSSCREGYVCEDDGTGLGVCIPACQFDADCSQGGCHVESGYCR